MGTDMGTGTDADMDTDSVWLGASAPLLCSVPPAALPLVYGYVYVYVYVYGSAPLWHCSAELLMSGLRADRWQRLR
ncbi:GL15255 [Drosophila persimilis]|uniref:GL15255 n=1 Tax=Drosophila persimilis TaxID=7234 RepID=B4H3W4_DROPE|nr:GL15255 [Drosophila persimilis]